MTQFETRALALLQHMDARLAVIERALNPALYKIEADGVLTRITDGAQVIPIRGKR
jgi:hypothetical protein